MSDSPSEKDWFRQAQYGMMVHWGLYALPDSLGRIPAPCQEILRKVGEEIGR